ncbi:PREDICTED: uncharacterized protein LOC109583024 isoform X1 [Amphimedon queenslandica]|uniref:Flavin reductase like domain-containing protein n=2 Tax=Amphimedon queenslandica TaxID=400682 RepID=A0AAN0J9M4_AMPQE|nr:PREDICTED: uncharacterized protein LOC109583024 isoform X1 [Amphimedon queenslandica]|eukprot:XP_019853740.1 PREDICTED: uncharacterized protein LOC109583024 isoform X1 [Amphimedon queenslandica]
MLSKTFLQFKVRFKRLLSSSQGENNRFLQAMRKVPSSVVVVTSSDGVLKRGITCSSFTSVSLNPPIISFCIGKPSRMHGLLLETKQFAVNVLSEKQIYLSIHFSKQTQDEKPNQFDNIPHSISKNGHPLLHNCSAVLECNGHSVHDIGDHRVWYGAVERISYVDTHVSPLLYYARSYHSVGDASFMESFESVTLAYEDWSHEAHLRMAWNYIKQHGPDKAVPLIKDGIKRFNDKNSDKIKRGYHETITNFFIHMICKGLEKDCGESFQEFLEANPYLKDSRLLFKYYSQELINSKNAKERWVEPDLAPLP